MKMKKTGTYPQRKNEYSGIVEKYSANISYEKIRACPVNTGPLPPGERASIRIMGMRRHHHCLKGDGEDPDRFREGSSPTARTRRSPLNNECHIKMRFL